MTEHHKTTNFQPPPPFLEICKDMKKYLCSSFIAIIDFEIKCWNKLDFKPYSEFEKKSINSFESIYMCVCVWLGVVHAGITNAIIPDN